MKMILLSRNAVFACLCLYPAACPASSFSQVVLKVGSSTGTPGGRADSRIEVSLDNRQSPVAGLHFDVCDEDNYLILEKTEPAARSAGLDRPVASELPDGCARIDVQAQSGRAIRPGTGPVLTLFYRVSPEAPLKEHRQLRLRNSVVADNNQQKLAVREEPGAVVFIKVQGRITGCSPEKIIASRTESTTHFILIRGEDTRFNTSSTFYFDPRDDIRCLGQTGFGNYLAGVIRLPPDPPAGSCDVGIYTDGGAAVVNGSAVFEIVVPR